MDLGDLLRRLNGVSTPFGGVSWVPPADERPVAQAVLAMLDRRVLLRPYEMEDRHHSLVSWSIRKALTEALGQVSQESRLAMHLRGMRAACRRFMDETVVSPSHRRWHFEDISFGIALGELRSAMGPARLGRRTHRPLRHKDRRRTKARRRARGGVRVSSSTAGASAGGRLTLRDGP